MSAHPDPLSLFPRFCARLTITSKETGVAPLILNGAQREFVRQMREGYAKGIRHFKCLKARQLGITTICLALDLFWGGLYNDILGALIADTDENRDMFRMTITQYHKGLPNELKFPVRRHNRNYLQISNGSILQYLVAGVRKNPNLGQGRAINYAHRTEVSSYGDPSSLDRSEAAYAEKHPHRLYVDESTAKGYNHWYDMWESAKQSQTQAAIFLAWWLKEEYTLKPDSADEAERTAFEVYRGMDLDSEEAKMVRAVKAQYGYDLAEDQLAWWRYKLNEQYKGNLLLLKQEYPATEEECFQMSGSEFFSGERLTLLRKEMVHEPPPKFFRYQFGSTVTDVKLHESGPQWDGARWFTPPGTHLRIWKEPVPGAVYAIGADPAYGSSEWKDNFSAQILRCWADKVEQVGEFCTAAITGDQFAWVLVHLAAYYAAPLIILEVTGPGMAVHQELNHIRNRRDDLASYEVGQGNLANVIGLVKTYLYKRQDSLGSGFAYHWKSNQDEKSRMMTHLQSSFENNVMVLHSMELLSEMKGVTREGDKIEAGGRAKDDRVIALGLAHLAWRDSLRSQLRDRRVMYQPNSDEWASLAEARRKKGLGELAPGSYNVAAFLRKDLQRKLR